MRSRVIGIVVALAVAAGLLGPAAPAQAATGNAGTVFTLTNAQRTGAGLKPLAANAVLDQTAQAWAQQLANTCTFAHSTSTWRTSKTTVAGWAATGENIAAGHTSASQVVTAWMNSSGHRANILNTRYTGLGVGYATSTRCYRTYWVQIFGIAKPPLAAQPLSLTTAAGLTSAQSTSIPPGTQLVAKTSGWATGTQLVYQWYRDGVAIPGSYYSAYNIMSHRYTTVAADVGKKISVRLTAYRWGYFPVVVMPAAAIVITAAT